MTDTHGSPGVHRARVPAVGIRFPRRVQWVGFGGGIAMIAIVWVLFPPNVAMTVSDQRVYEETVTLMQRGDDYYSATAQALEDVYHPSSTFLQVRTPIVFWVWRFTGISWPVAFSVIVVVGFLVGVLSWPLAGLAVAGWLTWTAHPPGVAEWAWNETWAVVPILVAMWLIRRERYGWAALAAVLAAATRETAVLVLIGGTVGAFVLDRDWRPWVAVCLVWLAFMAWHAHQVAPYIDPSGGGNAYVGSLSLAIDMAGVYVGPIAVAVIGLALWRSRWTFEWFFALPLMLLPLVGLFYYRGYWSFLVLPVAVALLGAERGAKRPGSSGGEGRSAITR